MLEFLYVLFLLSGYLKTIFQFNSISLPVDFTMLTAILVLLSGISRSFNDNFKTAFNKHLFVTSTILLIFSFWIIVKLFDSPSPSYKYEKFIGFGTNLFAFFAPLLLKKINIDRVLKYFSLLVLSLTFWFLPNYLVVMGTKRLYEISGLYLGLSFALGIVFLLFFKKSKLLPKKIRPLKQFVLLFILVLMISMGARGPLFFLMIILLIGFLEKFINIKKLRLQLKIKLNTILVLMYIFLGIIVGGVIYNNYAQDVHLFSLIDRSIYRFELLVEAVTGQGAGGVSIEKRTGYISFAIEGITNNFHNLFFGSGFGSFGLDYEGVDKRLYPHNMFLETWYELGIIGLIILLTFLWQALVARKYTVTQGVSFLVLMFVLLNLMKSSSLSDLRIFFGLIALSLVEYHLLRERFSSAPTEISNDRNIPPSKPIE